MKRIRYTLNNRANIGTAEEPVWRDNLFEKTISYSERAEEIAKQEAYNGEYEIYDDGKPEPVKEPSATEILNTLLGVNV